MIKGIYENLRNVKQLKLNLLTTQSLNISENTLRKIIKGNY